MEFDLINVKGGFEPLTARDGIEIKNAIFKHGGSSQSEILQALNDLDDLMLKRFYIRKEGVKNSFVNVGDKYRELDIEFGDKVGEAIMIISTKWAEYALGFLGKSPNYHE